MRLLPPPPDKLRLNYSIDCLGSTSKITLCRQTLINNVLTYFSKKKTPVICSLHQATGEKSC